MRLSTRTGLAAVLTAGIVIATPGSAHAAKIVANTTGPGNVGGQATHFDDGNFFSVCDFKADGLSAVGQLRHSGGSRRITDAGLDGDCRDSSTSSLREGQAIEIRACLFDGDGARELIHCSAWKRGER